ncbi:helix-turn-helix domain-containing protein [Pseudomonas sp. Irchel s3f19]|uniref:helix-turn-helix domain-containing protein n=1 Tax=Pseudomonas sp. Irchel s3f19 TaxID=2009146 RepID=UPI000BA312EA|nr:helix-turn-helix domain-containing protein [Pseudomonas sp. Irchel s3f19]
MTLKKKADQQASLQINLPSHTTTSAVQRARLLARLQAVAVDTITARRELNIMMPAARIKELKELGHNIQRHLITTTDEQGRTHRRVAQYYLCPTTAVEVEA